MRRPCPTRAPSGRVSSQKGSTPARGRTDPATATDPHDHGYDKVIVVAAGSIRFGLADGPIDLETGDRLELPAGTAHDAVVGASGVTCLEAHLAAGSLAAPSHRAAGTW